MALKRSGRGYPVNFVEPPPEQIDLPVDCPICFDVLYQPKMVSCCKHSFCTHCIGRIESDKKPCPLCGQKFDLTDNIQLIRILNSLKVYCPHRERGCEWKGELGDLQSHFNKDPKSNKLFIGCPFQKIQCGLCQSHSCERRLMTDHVLTQCPNRDVECEYHYAGCDVKKPQQQLESHGREAVSLHLSLVANLVQGSLSQKDNEIQELKEELRQQSEQIQELKQQHANVQRLTEVIRGELRRERHANHERHWMALLLLVTVGGIIHAYMYLHNDSSVELSSKIKNLTFHQQLLKEQFTNSCTYMSAVTHYRTLTLSLVIVMLVSLLIVH